MQAAPDASATSATIRLQFAEFRIDVETNSLRLASKLQSYFADYLASDADLADRQLHAIVGTPLYDASRMAVWSRPTSSGRAPKESYYDEGATRFILKNRTGVLIVLSPDRALITGKLEEHANQVVNLIGTLFGLELLERGYAMVHASAVVELRSGKALVFLGNSGSGKSSVALQLIERGGYAYLSNDRVLMLPGDDGVLVVGLPKKPRVNPGTLLASAALSRLVPDGRRREYARLGREELWRLEEKTDVDVGAEFGARSVLSAPLGQIFSLAWRTGGEGLSQTNLAADEAVAALRTVAKDFGPYETRGVGVDYSAQFGRIAELAPCVGVSGRADPRRLAASVVGR